MSLSETDSKVTYTKKKKNQTFYIRSQRCIQTKKTDGRDAHNLKKHNGA